jgi:hypothetical protein
MTYAPETTGPPPPPPSPPEPVSPLGYPSFEDHITEITGGGALDCGHLDDRATAKRMRAAAACASRAAKSGRPFLVIKSEYGIDSWVPHGLVRGRSGPVLRFSYDDLPGSDKFVTEPCASPAVTWHREFQRWMFTCAE